MNLNSFDVLAVSWDLLALLLCLLVVFPAWAVYRFHYRAAGGGRHTGGRVSAYRTIVGSQWLLVAALAWFAQRHGLSWAELGERTGSPLRLLGITLLFLLPLMVMTWASYRRMVGMPEDARLQSLGPMVKMLPINRAECWGYAALAVTAGICEELLFRGFLNAWLASALGSVASGLVAGSLLFGLSHAYQGRLGVIQTGLAGLALGGLYLWADSLIPGQILHAAIDLLSGFAAASVLPNRRS